MASKVEIANRALQILGAKRIVSLTEDSRNARAISAAFEPVKLAELRKHPWAFATKRVQLAASATAPAFTKARAFPLPADYVRLLPPDSEENFNDLDWEIEGKSIITNDSAPLNVRYIYDVTDPNEMDVLFRESFAAKLAEQLCEEITQSNTKVATAQSFYKDAIAEARRTNAIEKTAQKPPDDEWVTCRS
jgi:hypothetical protein